MSPNLRQAFDEYLDESAKAYVFRREPQFAEAVERIRAAGGIASLAHPIRVRGDVPALLPELCDAGLNAIEAYHSDHGERETGMYLELARKYGLLVTGGSDFHGAHEARDPAGKRAATATCGSRAKYSRNYARGRTRAYPIPTDFPRSGE